MNDETTPSSSERPHKIHIHPKCPYKNNLVSNLTKMLISYSLLFYSKCVISPHQLTLKSYHSLQVWHSSLWPPAWQIYEYYRSLLLHLWFCKVVSMATDCTQRWKDHMVMYYHKILHSEVWKSHQNLKWHEFWRHKTLLKLQTDNRASLSTTMNKISRNAKTATHPLALKNENVQKHTR